MISYDSTPISQHEKMNLATSMEFFVSKKQIVQNDDMILSVQVSRNPSRVQSKQASVREHAYFDDVSTHSINQVGSNNSVVLQKQVNDKSGLSDS